MRAFLLSSLLIGLLSSSHGETRTVTKLTSRTNAGEVVATVTIDTHDTPDLAEWGKKAGEKCIEWLPKLATLLASDGFVPSKEVTLRFDPAMEGVAATQKTSIVASKSPPGVAIGEPFVIDPQQMQHRRVQVVGVDGSFTGEDAVFVGFPVNHPAPYAAARHPGGEAEVMVLASGMVGLLVKGSPSKLRGPDDEGALEHAALFQVGEQAGDGLVDRLRETLVVGHVAVRIPVRRGTHIDELEKTHAPLRESPRDETLPSEAARRAALESVELQGRVTFAGEIKGLRGFALHPEGGLKRTDAGIEGLIGGAAFEMLAVQLAEEARVPFPEARGSAFRD